MAGTLLSVDGVPRVPDRAAEHQEHPMRNKVFHEKINEINVGTHRTFGTPDLLRVFKFGPLRIDKNIDIIMRIAERIQLRIYDGRDHEVYLLSVMSRG
mgnify:CR=1 FL=1